MRACMVVLAAGLACPVFAQGQGSGRVTGTVADSTRQPVTGAVIHVRGATLGALTGGDGRYTVRNLAAGTYTVVVTAVGYRPDTSTVAVGAGATVMHDVTLHAVVAQLAAVISRASPRLSETKQLALQQQKTAANIMSVMSGDEIRALPNYNAAEAAARIPGVSTERDEGEGKFVQIRGTEPRLSNVTIDGVHVPGTEGGDRIPKLDDVPADLLGAIQVSKTLRADMDADAIGGSVNLVTKAPEGPPRGYLAAQGGQASLLARTNGQVGFGYGGRVGDDGKFGYLINGSYDRNNRSIDDVEWGWGVDGSGRSYPVEWDQRDYLYGRIVTARVATWTIASPTAPRPSSRGCGASSTTWASATGSTSRPAATRRSPRRRRAAWARARRSYGKCRTASRTSRCTGSRPVARHRWAC